MIVHKFGGTSLGDASRFVCVADILIEACQGDLPACPASQVVIVSAISGVTDQLIGGARLAAQRADSEYRGIKARLLERHLEIVDLLLSNNIDRLEIGGLIEDRLHELERLYRSIAILGEVTKRVTDAVTSYGEQLSASILAAYLRERGLRAESLMATELIVTDAVFGGAHPIMPKTCQKVKERVIPLLDHGFIPVITGYIAATESGITTTLGRSGSDYSAAILGACLDAHQVFIWSDVNGILTADPNLVPQAKTLTELSYSEAAELAYYGAEVLHPKTIRPLAERGIPLRLLNSFAPHQPGTRIVKIPDPLRIQYPAIVSTNGLCLITIGSQDETWTPQFAARAIQALSGAGLDVPMFSQSFAEHSLNLVVRQQDQEHCLNTLCQEFSEHLFLNCTVEIALGANSVYRSDSGFYLGTRDKVATVSVVGFPGSQQANVVSQAFACLGGRNIRVIAVAQTASEYSVSFCIPGDMLPAAVAALHNELGLDTA